jgi:hypothetical protein
VRDPPVPWKLKFTGPSAAVLLAENVIACEAPAATWKGDAGDEVTPAGSPVIATATLPLKLFNGAIATETGELVLPCVTLTELGWTLTLKSAGTGGGVWSGVLLEPPPQATIDSPAASPRTNNKYRLYSVMENSS